MCTVPIVPLKFVSWQSKLPRVDFSILSTRSRYLDTTWQSADDDTNRSVFCPPLARCRSIRPRVEPTDRRSVAACLSTDDVRIYRSCPHRSTGGMIIKCDQNTRDINCSIVWTELFNWFIDIWAKRSSIINDRSRHQVSLCRIQSWFQPSARCHFVTTRTFIA